MLGEGQWLLATLISALFWGIGDVVCDICITEHEEEEKPGGYELVKLSEKAGKTLEKRPSEGRNQWPAGTEDENDKAEGNKPGKALRLRSKDEDPAASESFAGNLGEYENDHLVNTSGKVSRSDSESLSTNSDDEDDEEDFDGVQDCAVSGLSTGAVMYAIAFRRLQNSSLFSPKSGFGTGELLEETQAKFMWSPAQDSEWWMATLSGSLMFLHYMTILMAYDDAPSTVINPLVQVSSTWVLLGSAVPALLQGTTFITPFDFMCYVIIVAGGILPSVDGNLKRMLRTEFWKQRYVRNTVISEVSIGCYDLVMSYCLQTSGKKEKFREISPADMEFEFFFIAWCGFVVTFCLTFSLVPFYRDRFINLKKIPVKVLVLSSFGQALTMLGYFTSQFAYSWFYQASIVHAAEASLSQAVNLLLAVIAFKVFALGRASAVDNLKIKLVSSVVVSFGLFLLAISEIEENEEEGLKDSAAITLQLLDDLDVSVESELNVGSISG
eukprot:CAMPEP_0184548608 /NCGR_PEP_ID=MMETSP0199_2-20130426/6294_1 /TAXON_ID=1112570 /ORGANISM="Thraustochytrium sp., Strain LLF1b" /LENGTH=496 /DNA_ID=CAMNT_0026943229 /DNA_START=105 /DNA_END=1595 /DNA_ORIENTATION=+